jgi:type II secretory pathway predicted ATPase ExeA
MYMSFFNLNRNPFEISPDPHFFVPTAAHNEALAGLNYGIQAHKGFMVLTGEVGTGKTLVVRCLLDLLDRQKRTYAYIFCNNLSSYEFLSSVAADLGINGHTSSKSELLRHFQEFLLDRGRQGLYTALIVDEAQNLSPEILEEIRLLTNLETSQGKLLQIALIGQPELDATLERHNMRQLKQRIALRFRLPNLSEAQTNGYILDRLKLAGAENPIFSLPAIRRVFIHSKGIPRLINTLCDNALISTFAIGLPRVTGAIVDEVAEDLNLSQVENDSVDVVPSHLAGRGMEDPVAGLEFSKTPKEDNYYQNVGAKALQHFEVGEK